MLSSSVLLGGLLILIFAVTFILVRKQTKDLIEPINTLNLEEPLKDVAYEELRPLLGGWISRINRSPNRWKN